MVSDATGLTIHEAIKLWDDHKEEFMNHVERGLDSEMAIWKDMKHNSDYHTKSKNWHSSECIIKDGNLYILD